MRNENLKEAETEGVIPAGGHDADGERFTSENGNMDGYTSVYTDLEVQGQYEQAIYEQSLGQPAAGEQMPDEQESGEQDIEDASYKARMELYDWLQCVVSAIICVIFIFVFFGRTIGVDGRSMLQTLHDNDRVIMSNFFYTPKNGDIVVFQSQSGSFGGTPLVKRVIAVEGQTLDINFETGQVFVDGNEIDEPYITELTRNRLDFNGPITIEEGHVFVMGDNRNSSTDSRDNKVRQVDTRYILGKVLLVAVPGEDELNPRDWSRIGIVR